MNRRLFESGRVQTITAGLRCAIRARLRRYAIAYSTSTLSVPLTPALEDTSSPRFWDSLRRHSGRVFGARGRRIDRAQQVTSFRAQDTRWLGRRPGAQLGAACGCQYQALAASESTIAIVARSARARCAQSSNGQAHRSSGTIGTRKCVAPSAAAWSMPERLSNAAGIQSAPVRTSPTSREGIRGASPPGLEPHAGQNQAWRQLRTSFGGLGLAPTSTEPGLRGFRCRALGSTVTLARSWGKSHLLAV